jgi:hypothetical protein
MDSFSYLSVFISLILGLGVAHLLSGAAVLIRSRREVRLWWPTALWMATTFLIQVQTWWAMFTLRTVADWSFAAFLVVLLQPVAIFMMAALIVPAAGASGRTIELREDYFRESRWFFSALLVALAASLAKNLVLTGRFPEPRNLAAHILFIGIAIVALASRSARLHLILAVAGLALLGAHIALLFTTLS